MSTPARGAYGKLPPWELVEGEPTGTASRRDDEAVVSGATPKWWRVGAGRYRSRDGRFEIRQEPAYDTTEASPRLRQPRGLGEAIIDLAL
jgi:hypothetical protein